jgi:hypothetical protein
VLCYVYDENGVVRHDARHQLMRKRIEGVVVIWEVRDVLEAGEIGNILDAEQIEG